MIKIYFNEKSDAENKIKLTIKGLCVSAEVTGINPGAYGKDVIETLRPYSSYILVDAPGKVKNYRRMSHSDFKFLDMNRLGVAVKMDFANMLQHLWDSYALEVDGRLLMANRKGLPVSGDFMQPIIISKDKDYLDMRIVKYKGDFEGDTLTRDIDDEDVLVESTCGLVNNRRVPLENGVGTFRLYPMGHRGPFKLKLGRKWYEVWNEYNLVLEEDE